MLFFLVADSAYSHWVARHPNGFVVEVRSRAGAAPQVLHRAQCSELKQLTPTTEDAASPPRHPRACATDRGVLEAWADWEGYSLAYCRVCGTEAAWLAERFGPEQPIATAPNAGVT
jgi:hypothetical protein